LALETEERSCALETEEWNVALETEEGNLALETGENCVGTNIAFPLRAGDTTE
jgi:hypothetical protein